MPTQNPTVKQQQVLDFVKEYISQWGSAPTYREIGDSIGCNAGTVRNYLNALEVRGYITRNENESRSIQLKGKK